MLAATQKASPNESCARRLSQHLLAVLLCPDRATLTNLICTSGGHQGDWTADYRLYSKARVDSSVLLDFVFDEVLATLAPSQPVVVALDDTILRKSGTKIDGVAWRRDPLGPPFQTNLVRAQRFLQMSVAWPLEQGGARLLPVVFHHAPSAQKPPKEATDQEMAAYRECLKQQRLNSQALDQIARLRGKCSADRQLIVCGDGSYTNAYIVKNLPEGCAYIGRLRKDAKLHYLPEPKPNATGRPPRFGPEAPTPEELRTDETIPWQTVRVFACGKYHDIRVKTIEQVLWRKSGTAQVVRVVVIAPLGYRLRKGSKTLYRQPAFLLCTDCSLSLEQLVQYYLWRWGIEVNFREEKSLLGAGDAQVRTPNSNIHLPAMVVAAYSLLWLVALRMRGRDSLPSAIVTPKWRAKSKEDTPLPSTGDLLRTLRTEIWARAIRPGTFYDFVTGSPPDTKCQKSSPSLPAAVLCAA